MAVGKMGIGRLTKKTPAKQTTSSSNRNPESTPTFTRPISASQELQDIGGLLSKQSSTADEGNLSPHLNQQYPSSPLLRMPPEIRYEIYRYLIPQPARRFWPIPFTLPSNTNTTTHSKRAIRQPLYALRSASSASSSASTASSPLAILLTNKLIYHEALSVLYSEHLFHFIGPNYRPVLEFIRRLGPDARSQIRQIRLTLLEQEKNVAMMVEGEGGRLTTTTKHDKFCTVVHEACPGLTTLKADPVVWL